MNWTRRYGPAVWGLLVGFLCMGATPQGGVWDPARVLGVSVEKSGPAETRVEVKTSQPTPYRVFRLDNPRRLVLDLQNTEITAAGRTRATAGLLVGDVRLGRFRTQNGPVARVVTDLAEPYAFDVRSTSSGVEETVWRTAPRPALAAASTSSGSSEFPALNPKIEMLPARWYPSGGPSALRSSIVESEAQLSQLPAPNTATPREPTPISQGSEASSKYTGERITLNLKDVDLKDFFRLIHEISGLNIIVDPNVSGTLTLAMDDVPWDQALDIVLRNSGLDKVLQGNVLRIARLDTLASEADNQTKLAQAEAGAAPLVTVVRYLQYASSDDVRLNNVIVTPTGGGTGGGVTGPTSILGVATILKSMARAIMSPRGLVAADPRDNAVVITDIASQIPVIEAVIDKLDRKSQQVSIEARIVLTTSDVIRQLQSSLTNFCGTTRAP